MFEQPIYSDLLTVSVINANNKIVKRPLRTSVKQALKNYFLKFHNKNTTNLYEIALAEIEQPLLDIIMQYTRGNQTRAALIMGINRGTLRKKLKKYGMN